MANDLPTAGTHYPRSYADVLSWFRDDASCLDYLEWLRWPDGFMCPECGARKGWRIADGRWSCAGCARKVSVTAGTIFQGTRTPLTVWFAAAWQVTSQKNGISALGLKRVLGLGSEQTAWAMLHRFRTAMGRPEAHDLLPGVHRVASLAKRWLLGTHQGGVKPGRLPAYLDEFTFRFNRRRSRSRGLLFYRLLSGAVAARPRTYRSLVVGHPTTRTMMPTPRWIDGSDPSHSPGPRMCAPGASIPRSRPRPGRAAVIGWMDCERSRLPLDSASSQAW